jgi:hypothetical protein
LPRHTKTSGDEYAVAWPMPVPFSDIVREAIGNHYRPSKVIPNVMLKLAYAETLWGVDNDKARELLVEATALLMTCEYDMLGEILKHLDQDWGYSPGEWAEPE